MEKRVKRNEGSEEVKGKREGGAWGRSEDSVNITKHISVSSPRHICPLKQHFPHQHQGLGRSVKLEHKRGRLLDRSVGRLVETNTRSTRIPPNPNTNTKVGRPVKHKHKQAHARSVRGRSVGHTVSRSLSRSNSNSTKSNCSRKTDTTVEHHSHGRRVG